MSNSDKNSTISSGFEMEYSRDVNKKRTNYLDWDEYFMATAVLAAMRSKNPLTKVGACIVDKDKKIVGIGYNGMPTACYDKDSSSKEKSNPKYLYAHAELNAILNKNTAIIKNCIMYVKLFPCNDCIKVIVQSGIRKVIYMLDTHLDKETVVTAKKMLDDAKVDYCQFKPKNRKIVIDFSEINWNAMTQLPPTPVKYRIGNTKIQSRNKPESKTVIINFSHDVTQRSPATATTTENGKQDINNSQPSYLDWNKYCMATAFLAAMRSKDPVTQVGACIVNKYNRIVGVGYNGMPTGCHDDDFPWNKESKDPYDTKHLYVCHAELNAILNNNASNIKNCSIFVGLFPCNKCAKAIVRSGIKKVIYMSDKHRHKITTLAAKKMLDDAKVNYCQYQPKNKKIVIDFSETNWNAITQIAPTPVKDRIGNTKIESRTNPGSKTVVIDFSHDVTQRSPATATNTKNGEQDSNNNQPTVLDWDKYFMATVSLLAVGSNDPVIQVGACIVNKYNRIVSVGYNSMSTGYHNDNVPWNQESEVEYDTKHLYECHAESNAILNQDVSSIKNCSIIVGLFPCNECAIEIVQSGIKKVFYMSDKHRHKVTTRAAKRMFDAAKIEYRQYQLTKEKVDIDFSKITWNDVIRQPPFAKTTDYC